MNLGKFRRRHVPIAVALGATSPHTFPAVKLSGLMLAICAAAQVTSRFPIDQSPSHTLGYSQVEAARQPPAVAVIAGRPQIYDPLWSL